MLLKTIWNRENFAYQHKTFFKFYLFYLFIYRIHSAFVYIKNFICKYFRFSNFSYIPRKKNNKKFLLNYQYEKQVKGYILNVFWKVRKVIIPFSPHFVQVQYFIIRKREINGILYECLCMDLNNKTRKDIYLVNEEMGIFVWIFVCLIALVI